MKVALIPPTPELKTFGCGNFHLLLSHLLTDAAYVEHYAEMRRQGAYLILDNSAHEEGEGHDPEVLMFNALSIDAQEVVVPDALDNAEKTVELAVQALEVWFEGKYAYLKNNSPALMYVPQGENEEEWSDCLTELVRLHKYIVRRYGYREDFVVGVSKDYEVWDGGILHLIDTYLDNRRQVDKKVKVHLLGWGRDLWALEKIGKKHPWIRSTDSAKPFVYALSNIDLWDHMDESPQYPKRPADYFDKRMTQKQVTTAKVNSMLFAALASGSRGNTVIL